MSAVAFEACPRATLDVGEHHLAEEAVRQPVLLLVAPEHVDG